MRTLSKSAALMIGACALALAMAGCSKPAKAPGGDAQTSGTPASAAAPVAAKTAPAGDYVTDPAHSSLTFKISHMGYSTWTGRFEKVTAHLTFDPKTPAAMRVEADIDPRSLAHDNPPAGFLKELAGKEFLDADAFPAMTFKSTRVVVTGADTADVTGDLTLHGVTKPVVLHVKYNGGYAGMSMDPHARAGFSAHGSLKRSDFGVSMGLPPPGSAFGVGDQVDVDIETEMTGPPLAKPAAG